jgi:hypothetical protein
MQRVLRFAPVAAAVVTLAAAACSSGDVADSKGQLTMKGTVHSSQSADGTQCWKFQSAKGKDYELQPAQAPAEILIDGQAVTIVAKTRTGGSFCNVGTIVDVVSVAPATGT